MTSTAYNQTYSESHPQRASLQLPWELSDTIIDFLHAETHNDADSRDALATCSSVCSQFLLRSRFHTFATVQLWPWRARRFFELVASPGCTFARVVRRIEVDDRARRLGGRMGMGMRDSSSSNSRTRASGNRSESRKTGVGVSVERSGSRARGTLDEGQPDENTEYMRFADIMALAQHHLPVLDIDINSLSISNVDWTSLPATQAVQLRANMVMAFPRLRALELHGATFHDMRELGRVVGGFEKLSKMSVQGTVFLKYPEHVTRGAEDVALGRPGVLKIMDLGREEARGRRRDGDGPEVPAVLVSVVDGLVELAVRGLRKTHVAHIQRVFREKGKALEKVCLFFSEDPDATLGELDLSTLSSLRTLAIHGLQPTSLASSTLLQLLKRVEAPFFDTIELGLRLDCSSTSVLPQLDCSTLQKVLLEHRFFGLRTVRIVVDGHFENGEQSIEQWIKIALQLLQGMVKVLVSTKEAHSSV